MNKVKPERVRIGKTRKLYKLQTEISIRESLFSLLDLYNGVCYSTVSIKESSQSSAFNIYYL